MVLVVCKTAASARAVGEQFGDYVPALTLPVASRFARGGGFRVILLDVLAGTSARSAIEELPLLARFAPVVVLTTRLDASTIDQAVALGAAGAVCRHADELPARVSEAVEEWRREREQVRAGRLSRLLH